MKYVVTHGETEIVIFVEPEEDGRYRVEANGKKFLADYRPAGGRSLQSLILGAESFETTVVHHAPTTTVVLRGQELNFLVESEQVRNARLVEGSSHASGPHTVKSVMPGRVVKVLAREGEEVAAGTPLLILEAMKMENEIKSTLGGTVTKILVRDGQAVSHGDPLIVIG